MGKQEPPPQGQLPLEGRFVDEARSRQRQRTALALADGERAAMLHEAERVGQLGSWAWDANSEQVIWSENLYEILGYDPGTELPTFEALYARVHPAERSLAVLSVERTKHSDQPESVGLRLLLPDQGERHVLLRGCAVRNIEGKIVRVVGTLIDVSDSRVTEPDLVRRTDEFAESEAGWRAIVENPFDYIVLVNEEGVFQWVNHTAPGVTREQLLGRVRIYDFMDPASHPEAKAALASVFETGEAAYYETYSPQLDAWFGNVVGAYKKSGRVELASILARDISTAKRAENELVRRTRMLVEAERIAHVGSWQWDRASERLDWSEELYRIFGVSRETTPTQELFWSLVVPEDLERVRAESARIIATGVPLKHEYRIRRLEDGAVRQVQTAVEILRDLAGEVSGFIGATVDLTERKELEEHVARIQRLEALGRLAGGLAHDFNNALTVILGQTELAGRSQTLEPQVRESLSTIREASERASRMTRQLLAFASRQVLDPRSVEPRAEIRSLVRLFQPLLGEDIEVRIALDDQTWPVCIDPSQLEQLVMNLAINARDAMEFGGILSILTGNVVRTAPSGATSEYVRIAVSDTGSGMTPEVRARVFEPFFTTKPVGKGTGIGLATCENIVRQAGGFIEVESELGRGTAFNIYLPRAELPAASAHAVSEYPTSLTGQETILVIEDMALVRKLCVRVLSGLGYVTLSAETAAEALAVVAEHNGLVHLIMTDMVLPDRPGTEVAEELLLLYPEARVLFTSGYSEVTLPTSLGPRQHFLPKPYTPSSLSRKIRQLLDEASQSSAN